MRQTQTTSINKQYKTKSEWDTQNSSHDEGVMCLYGWPLSHEEPICVVVAVVDVGTARHRQTARHSGIGRAGRDSQGRHINSAVTDETDLECQHHRTDHKRRDHPSQQTGMVHQTCAAMPTSSRSASSARTQCAKRHKHTTEHEWHTTRHIACPSVWNQTCAGPKDTNSPSTKQRSVRRSMVGMVRGHCLVTKTSSCP